MENYPNESVHEHNSQLGDISLNYVLVQKN